MTSATVTPTRQGRRATVNPNLPSAIARASMTMTQIFNAGVAAGSEATGVWAVYAEGRKLGSVIDAEGRYIGVPAVTVPWSMRSSAVALEHESLPASVYSAFKSALGSLNLEQTLALVYGLGQESVRPRDASPLPALDDPDRLVLGVGPGASRSEIEDAYRRLASRHHPDRGGDQHEMARINAARAALLGT